MKEKRQVIFIMTDTQRKDMLGCYGNKDMKTPCLDKMADEGVRFNKAYSCQPVCGPARSALFTGTFPHSNGSWGNCMPLGDNVKTLGQRLQDNNVNTAYIGKWHLDGGDYFGNGACPEGWDPDFWYDMRNYLEELTPEERQLSRSPELNRSPDLTEEFTFGHRCSDRAIDYLKSHSREDFFLVLSYDEPHDPFVCPRPFSEMYRDYRFPKNDNVLDSLEGKPEHHRLWAESNNETDYESLEIRESDYFGCNSFIDYEIGRVLDAAREYADEALIIYTSDHGDFLHSHKLSLKGPAMYDEITNIPFIVKWPSAIEGGHVSDQLVSHINFTPTVLDYFGIGRPAILEGRSLLPLFKNPDEPVDDSIFMEFGRYEIDHDGFGGFQPVRCTFDGRYKLVINLLCSDELYDLKEDPSEMKNLIVSPDHKTIRNRLHDRLLDWMNDTRDPFRGYYWENRSWREDARKPTWDYTGMTRQRMESSDYEPRQLDYATGMEIREAVRKK